ncbi:sulfatase-like hydrolase/transferase [Flammeovirga yaeyamensis]|uniref:Sulfatase-like hydrolase/transferase n=1 Tax=Flammeovirga yaeyamensis TaxID=367791 RepID=A0AAX1NER6_9BACT|nr:sulfatase-like hydrolase/transferase [Flammeovirga yaeyamensis]MBB3696902.1 arylsulfatase A-like enzyme [Flammeovirga yaeyamensis]NMF33566.1 sulfatase-like hydrolase/transferase [Flammeovirga yaeyamensis]QWG05165.1 sulfatase-like hydrolase/transferase [Flammeovirga yaeyamensis]
MKSNLILTLLVSIFLTSHSYAQKKQPNFLIIVADDLGYGDLGVYGAKDVLSPNIDKLAKEGTQYTNFHTTSSVCSPSRASMYTGKTPDLVGVPGVVRVNESNSFGYFDPSATTIMDLLKEKTSYETSLIGKWHLGHQSPNLPNDRGFDFFHGWLVGMTDYYEHIRYKQNWMRKNQEELDTKGHVTDLFTDWALDYLDQDRKDPFMMFLTYTAPHSPLQPPADYLEKVMKREKGISEKRAKYVALIEHMDKRIGDVVAKLKEKGELDNTVIMFLSDNGGALNHGANNGEFKGQKGDLYEGGLRVPFIVRWNEIENKGKASDAYVSITDIFPTVARIAGVSYEEELSGIDQTNLFKKGEIQKEDRVDIAVRRGNRSNCVDGSVFYSVQKNGWKYVQNSACEPYVFYNMNKDKNEQHPIPAEDLKKKMKNFDKILRKHIVNSGKTPWAK